jgi:hypothetical protein
MKKRKNNKKGLSEAGKIGGALCRDIYGVIFFSILSYMRKNKTKGIPKKASLNTR